MTESNLPSLNTPLNIPINFLSLEYNTNFRFRPKIRPSLLDLPQRAQLTRLGNEIRLKQRGLFLENRNKNRLNHLNLQVNNYIKMSNRSSFHLGRRILASIAILVGIKIFTAGLTLYDDPLNQLRKLVLPHNPTNFEAFGQIVPYEQLNEYIVKTIGALFILAGVLIMINRKNFGSALLIIAVVFQFGTRLNPFLKTNIVNTNSLKNLHMLDMMA